LQIPETGIYEEGHVFIHIKDVDNSYPAVQTVHAVLLMHYLHV